MNMVYKCKMCGASLKETVDNAIATKYQNKKDDLDKLCKTWNHLNHGYNNEDHLVSFQKDGNIKSGNKNGKSSGSYTYTYNDEDRTISIVSSPNLVSSNGPTNLIGYFVGDNLIVVEKYAKKSEDFLCGTYVPY